MNLLQRPYRWATTLKPLTGEVKATFCSEKLLIVWGTFKPQINMKQKNSISNVRLRCLNIKIVKNLSTKEMQKLQIQSFSFKETMSENTKKAVLLKRLETLGPGTIFIQTDTQKYLQIHNSIDVLIWTVSIHPTSCWWRQMAGWKCPGHQSTGASWPRGLKSSLEDYKSTFSTEYRSKKRWKQSANSYPEKHFKILPKQLISP